MGDVIGRPVGSTGQSLPENHGRGALVLPLDTGTKVGEGGHEGRLAQETELLGE